MNSIWVALIGAVWLLLAYHLYGRFIERRLARTDPHRKTPAHTSYDGVDYQPTRPMILFGHHFASIAGAGPIIGPVVAAMAFGWVAGAIWILLGVVFIGAVHDYMALTVSIHHDGRSISDTSRELVGRRSWLLFQVFVWIALVLVIAVFIDVAVRSFQANPEIVLPAFALLPIALLFGLVNHRWKVPLLFSTLVCLGLFALAIAAGAWLPITLPGSPETVFRLWFLILALYGWVASVLPVWILLQPRDYIANWVLMIGITLGALGLFVGGYPITAPAFTGLVSADHGPIFPMLFVLIACGAVSGFHSLVASGTSSKQLDRESHARLISFGGMILEGGVALLALLAVTAGLYWQGTAPPGSEQLVLQNIEGGPVIAFGAGFGRFVAPFFGMTFGLMLGVTMLNTFVLTTLDTSTRLTRFVTSEVLGTVHPLFRNRYLASALAVIPAFLLGVSGGWKLLWPLFASSNQMIAALALFVATAWLVGRGRPSIYTLLPALFMLATSVSAFGWQAWRHFFLDGGSPLLGALCLMLLSLALVVSFDALRAVRRYSAQRVPVPERTAPRPVGTGG
jgi:carbon starvation protein